MKKTKNNSILIIDDSDLTITMLSNILEPEYTIYSASNGKDGIEKAKRYNPDIIILDIIMPVMDGYETIARLKRSNETRGIPVIFMTGLANTRDEEKGLALGGADYISKPFSAEVVKLRVNNQVQILNYISTIKHMSQTDQLTGLHNRRSFDERLLLEWRRAKRENVPISILIMDIDNFKKCNDTYGHFQGDLVIKSIAEIIKRNLKRSADFSARWGGEEFIALLPGTDREGAGIIAESIRKSVEHEVVTFPDGRSTSVTMSIGTNTQIPSATSNASEFIRFADESLYMAKNEGRNKVFSFKG